MTFINKHKIAIPSNFQTSVELSENIEDSSTIPSSQETSLSSDISSHGSEESTKNCERSLELANDIFFLEEKHFRYHLLFNKRFVFEFDDRNYSSDEDETNLKPETLTETSSDLPSVTSFDSGLVLDNGQDLETNSKLDKDPKKTSSSLLMNLVTPCPPSKYLPPSFKHSSFKKVSLVLTSLSLVSNVDSNYNLRPKRRANREPLVPKLSPLPRSLRLASTVLHLAML